MISAGAVEAMADHLATVGLNRCRAVDINTLPPEVWLPGHRPSTPTPMLNSDTGTTLILVGHAGTRMWDHLTAGLSATLDPAADPIDNFSIETTDRAIGEQWPQVERRLLYPHPDCPVDLVALGRAIGWQADSPLGLGIHPEYGLWSAFRALWMLSADLADGSGLSPAMAPDVCRSCETQDCVDACPPSAVEVGARFNLTACFSHRAEHDSSCAETCLARRACPVGSQHRYSQQQMVYHYRLSRPQA